MRLFIAINFIDETRKRLLAMRDELRSLSKRGNYSAPENLHLTLAFLGECDPRQTAVIKSIMDAIGLEPFQISIDRVGRFKRDGGDIWWAGIKPAEPLSTLHGVLTDNLKNAGFILDKRKYNPHVTLGREIVTDAEPWKITPFGETVSCIDLMKSERINGKLAYTSIYGKKGRST